MKKGLIFGLFVALISVVITPAVAVAADSKAPMLLCTVLQQILEQQLAVGYIEILQQILEQQLAVGIYQEEILQLLEQ